MKLKSLTLSAVLAVLCASVLWNTAQAEEKAVPASPLEFKVQDIAGKEVDLQQYKGKVVMIVNVASKCGLTKQYTALQALHEKYKDQGLAILGFPANNFGGQEPGTNEEIQQFCSSRFHVSFDMFAKVSVKGDDIAPLFQWLTSEETNKGHAGEIAWNFNKFLVGRDGKVIDRFEPRTAPDEESVTKAIEAALAAKA
jgi:glutathione peroxidase